MPVHELSPGNGLDFEHVAPSGSDKFTYVFFNALTGDKAMWLGSVIPALRDAGHGYLVYNLRGQAGSPYSQTDFTEDSIVADAMKLLESVKPERPVHVGLSIGGLFSIKLHLMGGAGFAEGIIFLNTLRRDGARLKWVNEAVVKAVGIGGPDMLKALYSPMLMNEEWLDENREAVLANNDFPPIDPSSPVYHLLKSGGTADWNIRYEDIKVPVLNISGLQDRVFLNLDDVDSMCARLPDVERIDMANCGHMIPVERPAELAAALVKFGEKLAARNS